MALSFGVFDHLDASGAPLRDFYEDRLKLAELYDRLGFYCYQVAEHHSTALGMAQSFVSKYEMGERRLDFIEVARICGELGIGLEAFATSYVKAMAKSKGVKAANDGKGKSDE